MPGRPLKRDWLHCNSLDYNAKSGHIVINSVQGELYVIDHDGTFVAGDPQGQHRQGRQCRRAISSIASATRPATPRAIRRGFWRTGTRRPPATSRWAARTTPRGFAPGLPGAGHLMVFNNGQYLYQRTPQSSVLEINPFLDANGHDTGKYVNPPEAGYRRETYDHDTHNQPRQISKQIVWSYRSVNSHGFFSHIGSSGAAPAERQHLHLLRHRGPFLRGDRRWRTRLGIHQPRHARRRGEGARRRAADGELARSARIRYAADHPAFKGRDLTPKGTITERAAQGLDVYPKRRPPGDRPPNGSSDRQGRRGRSDERPTGDR